ncbi:hypothetical protein ACFW04_004070 [Cataglyphis niger]
MAAFNGVRVLPDMPKNVLSMETLIQEFETGLKSSNRQDSVLKSSTSHGGSFVKKIVEAYESSIRASIENVEEEHTSKRSGLFNTIRNQKNVEKTDSSPLTYGKLSNSLKNTSETFVSSVVKKHDLEDDFAMPNRCRHSKSDKKTDILKTWSGISSKINKYSFMRELTNSRPNSSKKSKTKTLKRKGQIFCSPSEGEGKYKSKNNMPLICSSPLEDVDDKDMDYDEDPLDNILTNSHDSSNNSNDSYKNLQVDLYHFESEDRKFELSSTSSQSLNSSSRSLCDDTSSTKSYNDNLLLESSFQNITVVPDVLNDYKNLQDMEQILKLSSNFNRESPRVIGVSLKRPIEIDNDISVTWIPVLDEKLPQKKSLKKILSMFNRAKLSLNHRKISKKSKDKQSKKQHIFDSGFIEQCPSVSSFSSQQSWHSDTDHVDDEPSTPLTFGTFGRVSEHCTGRTGKNRMMLTEILHAPQLASDFVSSDPNSWISSRSSTSLDKEPGHQDVESSSRNMSTTSSSKSRVFCKYPSLPKHPHLNRSSIPKHPFVAQTKMDQIEEEEAMTEKVMQCDEKVEQKPDVLELTMRCSSSSPIPVPQSTNISHFRMPKCTDSSTNSNYDLPNWHRSASALDEVVLRRQASVYDVPKRSWLSSLTMDPSSPINNLYEEIVPCEPRFATVSPKNFRFFISQEKSRAIEKSFDS